jgi:PKD repeat protein
LWDFGDGNTSTLQNPSHTYTASGVYTVSLTATNGFGNDVFTQSSFITINLPVAPVAAGTFICPGTNASLTATGADSLFWYTSPTGGTPVFTGPVFNTPVLNTTTSYYVESSIFPAQQYVGPADNTIGGGNNYNNAIYRCEYFDCFSPVRLVSVKVFAQGAGVRTITLTNSAGTVINTANLNIPDGTSRITLNFDLLPGTNYELGIPGGNADLYRNNSGAVYPYNLSGLVSITGSNAGAPGYYYYFYDWELQEAPCTSPRTPVTVDVSAILADFSFTSVMETYTFTDNSTGAVTWFWDFDDGATSTQQNPVHEYTVNGVYNVMLVVSDGTCSDTIYQAITVLTVGIGEGTQDGIISIYPIPASGLVWIHYPDAKQNSGYYVEVFNMQGQIIRSVEIPGRQLKDKFRFDISGIAAGIYEIMIRSGQDDVRKRLVVE